MLGLPQYQKFLIFLQMVALIGLVFRLFQTGLHRTYPVFFYFLVAEVAQSIVLSLTDYGSVMYRNLFLVTASTIVCFYVLIVLELYTIVWRNLTGIASLARTFTKISLGIAVVVSLLVLKFENRPANVVGRFIIVERSIILSLVFFVLLVTAFLVYYPTRLNRNVIVYSIGYAFYFLSTATALFVDNIRLLNITAVNYILLTVSALSLLFWLACLNRQGEKTEIVMGHLWDRRDETRLLRQLQDINASLLRTIRK